MKIVQISDCHLFADRDKIGYNNINPRLSLKHILTEVHLQQPDVLLITGDISADGSGQSYQHFYNLLREAKIDCRVGIIPGNHDNQTQLLANLPAQYLWLNNPQLVLMDVHNHLVILHHFHLLGKYEQGLDDHHH